MVGRGTIPIGAIAPCPYGSYSPAQESCYTVFLSEILVNYTFTKATKTFYEYCEHLYKNHGRYCEKIGTWSFLSSSSELVGYLAPQLQKENLIISNLSPVLAVNTFKSI